MYYTMGGRETIPLSAKLLVWCFSHLTISKLNQSKRNKQKNVLLV